MTRGRVLVAAAAVAALVALIPVGRWERTRHAERQMSGVREVWNAVGGRLDAPGLSGYRLMGTFNCVTYRRGGHDFGLELCVDPEGRVIEAIDRRGDEPEIWSIREDPTRSTLRVDPDELSRLLERMGAPTIYTRP